MSLKDYGIMALFLCGIALGFYMLYWAASAPRVECMTKTCADPAKSPAMIQGNCLCVEAAE